MDKYFYHVSFAFDEGARTSRRFVELDHPLEYEADVEELEKSIRVPGGARVIGWQELKGRERPLTR